MEPIQRQKLTRLLQSQTTPSLPPGLKERVLSAVHEEQQNSQSAVLIWRKLGLAMLGIFSAVSVTVFLFNLTQNGFHTMAATVIGNYNTMPAADAFMALLETLPLGTLTLALIFITALCWLLSVRTPKTTPAHHLTLNHI